MENNTKRYWRGIEELTNNAEFVKYAHREFGDAPTANEKGEALIDGTNTVRRDFLKVLGFGVSAVALAACEAPVKKAIPYLNKPEDVEPTIANWYASTFIDGGDYASILVKTREGRPIKVEVNPMSSITKGISARVHASVLSLYDNEKLKGATIAGKPSDWATTDKEIIAELGKISARGGQIRIVSNTIVSPTTKKVISEFIAKYSTAKLVTYDANSVSGLIQANGGILPSYNFSKAKTIVSIGADFLGTWLSADEFSEQWAKTRRVSSAEGGNKEMSRHYQFESIMSMTGANADYRSTYKPSQEGLVVTSLYNALASKLGATPIGGASIKIEHFDKAVSDLVATKAASIVVSGSNDPAVQTVVIAINAMLGAYGKTIDAGMPSNYRQGSDAEMTSFINEAKAGQIGAVVFYNANPVYNHPRGAELAEVLPKIGLTISTNDRADETGSLCKYNTPDSHYLESWNDAEPKRGYFSFTQPTISTIFKTRQAQSSFLTWAGLNGDYATYLENAWSSTLGGKSAWSKALHDGVYEPGASASFNVPQTGLADAVVSISKNYKANSDKMELAIYEKVIMGTGSQANNPWLQECPEPVSKACWGNYAMVSLATAKKLGLDQEIELDTHEVEVSVNGKSVKLPFIVQPGQANDTVAIAIGYGRTKAGKSANEVGANIYPFASFINGNIAFSNTGDVQVKATGNTAQIARTQTHNTVMAREAVVQETVLSAYKKNVEAGRFKPTVSTAEGKKTATDLSLWNGHKYNNHAWGMVIDLNTCTGCSACVVSCNAENNIAVVGRKEVINRREMHWMRIDRYYSSDADVEDVKGLEYASENPEVVFQPMLCQHCNNAPCETVCPVLATTHSSEGLNQMTYNRCIGTRYCANNCPYKVRRFNWFRYYQTDEYDFQFNNDLGRMVINPDVTVRSRGVMEKCSMCVQRIQAGKLEAKKEKRRPKDGEIQTACSQSCPTNAITFGDMNDETSEISKLLEAEHKGRAFGVIEEINVKPNISYLVKIRNKEEKVKKEEATVEHKEHA
ncbi:TAT-variant-translocated molybdopterin oxidoreductase [Arcicella sp. LKC2W]|uniref:TAT-variant-translocated molybdopterin oxidoreductase n=1 Tax=Arcicella sp. LKC2W TaxID=2984198 RepID=UPI002B2011D9|nr:TAT-variant-translocated molybdopterin oxidoreductase [Arcicella sp. LKC2W]MEA5457916.1 TAT-variant-translocated molybdopterin oxidoreductase [Arcicella sp. LKC2W]